MVFLFVALMLGFSMMKDHMVLLSIAMLLAFSIIIARNRKTTSFTSTTFKVKSLT
jgi:hypothetical protein